MKHKSIQAHSIWSLVVTLIFIPSLPNNHLTYLVQKIGHIIHFIVNYNPTRRHVSVNETSISENIFDFVGIIVILWLLDIGSINLSENTELF